MGVEEDDKLAKSVQKTANRVALADIEAAILHVEYINPTIMPHLTIAVIYLQNGWAETGHSAPADADNFDAELGKKFAKEAALRKLWPLFGFHLREKLHAERQ
jgi:Phage protein (N4 Gp49/phage Sf6 gene 66) family